jgi:hypothetical protein
VSSDTWDFLRDKKLDVDWWHLNWYPHAISKHALVLWLAVQNRLITGDRLLECEHSSGLFLALEKAS